MKRTAGIAILIFFLFHTTVIFAKENEPNWQKLNELAEQVLQLGKQGKYEEAKQILANFSTDFLKRISEQKLSLAEIKTIISAYEQADEALTAVKMSEEERINKLLQFRLTVNAVTNEHHPMWLDAKNMVLEPLQKALQAIRENEPHQFQRHVNDFLTNYEIIRPSLIISLPEHEFERYNSYVKYIENNRHNIDQKQLKMIQTEFQSLFENPKLSNAEPELIGLMYTIGGIIAVTLIYVGWRKYKGEKRKKQMKDLD